MEQIKAVAAKRVNSSSKQICIGRACNGCRALATHHVDDEISSAEKWQRNPKGNGHIEDSVIRFDEMMDHPICLLAVTRSLWPELSRQTVSICVDQRNTIVFRIDHIIVLLSVVCLQNCFVFLFFSFFLRAARRQNCDPKSKIITGRRRWLSGPS